MIKPETRGVSAVPDAGLAPMNTTRGILELTKDGAGRLRCFERMLSSGDGDPHVPQRLVQKHDLRPGLELEVTVGRQDGNGGGRRSKKKKRRGQKGRVKQGGGGQRVEQVVRINGEEPQQRAERRAFKDLTSIDPEPRMSLEYAGCPPSCRLIDLFCPIGFGTRGMIVSPPKAGKTVLLQQIATAVYRNHPEAEVMALLIDERPEEVTDFSRNVPCRVWASSNDHPPETHVTVAALAIEHAKRAVEEGRHAVILLDSLTRLGRAYNTAPGMANSGRTLSGGVDSTALAVPKQLFGSARNLEEGGSLTIVATCLVDTGSRGDQVIFEEFKGTGNMELILDRKIAERRLYPAMDLASSGTRKEDKLLADSEIETMGALRRRLLQMEPSAQIDQLLKALERFETNDQMVGG